MKYEVEEKLSFVNQLVNDKVRESLITHGKPQKPISRDSVGKWIKKN